MGLALAAKFHHLGYQLVLVARTLETLEKVEQQLPDALVSLFTADLGDEEQIASLFNVIRVNIGHPEVLIYNASAFRVVAATAVTIDQLKQDMAISVGGVIASTRAVIENMIVNQKGTILITGGGSGIVPMAVAPTLSIGKAALRNLALQLFNELAPKGVHVATVTICGPIQKGTYFDPAKIADVYEQLHLQTKDNWQQEFMYK